MFYVYEWYIIDTNEVFYVGKGCKDRYKNVTRRNKLFKEVFKKNKCNVRIIKYFKNELDAFNYEHYKICELKDIGQCKCNLDNGGKGGVNFIWTPEMRDYYSKYNVMKSEKQRQRMSSRNPMKNPEIAKKVNAQKRKHPIINNQYYNSVEEASKAYNVSDCTIRIWCKQGYNTKNEKCHWSCEKEKVAKYIPYTGKKVIYDNKIFPSIKELAKHLKLSKSTISSWLKYGFSTTGVVCKYLDDKRNNEYEPRKTTSSKAIIINGIEYKSVLEASKKLRVKETTLHYHIHNNTGKYQYKYVNQQPSASLKGLQRLND